MAIQYLRNRRDLDADITEAIKTNTLATKKDSLLLRCDTLTGFIKDRLNGSASYLSNIEKLRDKILNPPSSDSLRKGAARGRTFYSRPRLHAPQVLTPSAIKQIVEGEFSKQPTLSRKELLKYKQTLLTSKSRGTATGPAVDELIEKITTLELLIIAKKNGIDTSHPLLIMIKTVYSNEDVALKNAAIQSALERLNDGYSPLCDPSKSFSEHIFGGYWAACGAQDGWDAKNHITENPAILFKCIGDQFSVMLADHASGVRHQDKGTIEIFSQFLEKEKIGHRDSPPVRFLAFCFADTMRSSYTPATRDAARVYTNQNEPLKHLQEIIDHKETDCKVLYLALEKAQKLFPELSDLNPFSKTFHEDVKNLLTSVFKTLGKKNETFKYLIWKLHHDAWIKAGSPRGKEPGGDNWGGNNYSVNLSIFVQALQVAKSCSFKRLDELKAQGASADRALLLAILHDASCEIAELKKVDIHATDIFAEIDRTLDEAFHHLETKNKGKASQLKFLVYKHYHDAWEKGGKVGEEPGKSDSDFGGTHKRDSYTLFFSSLQKVTAPTITSRGSHSAFSRVRRAGPQLVPSTLSTITTADGITAHKLHNPSQNCWINALMQFLVLNPELRTKFLNNIPADLDSESERAKFKQFADTYVAGTPLHTQPLREAMHAISNSSPTANPISRSCYVAEDAAEALNLLGGCFGTYTRETAEAPRSVITPFVEGLHTELKDIRRYHRGREAGAASPLRNITPTMMTGGIQVDPTNAEFVSSEIALRELVLKVTLSGSDSFHFEDLLAKTFRHPPVAGSEPARYDGQSFEVAEIQKQYTKVPKTLLLQLNRYGSSTTFTSAAGSTTTTHTRYKVQNDIDVAATFVLPDGAIEESKKPLAADGVTRLNPVYSLTGFVLHQGGLSGGHYTSYIKKNDTHWICCNDSTITEITHAAAMERAKKCYITSYSHTGDITDAEKAALRTRRQDEWNAAVAAGGVDAAGVAILNKEKKDVSVRKTQTKQK